MGGSGRQPGSTFKTFVLGSYLEGGGKLYDNYDGPASLKLMDGWEVSNYDNESTGEIDVSKATADSTNTVYAQMIEKIGSESLVAYANKVGIKSELAVLPSTGLGSAEVSPYELAGAYSTYMNRGVYKEPTAILSVENSEGDLLYKNSDESVEVITPENAD